MIFEDLSNKHKICYWYVGIMHPLTPHPVFFLFVAMQRERIPDKKEKHADRLITAKLNQKRVNSLYICHPELVSGSNFTAQTALVLLLFR